MAGRSRRADETGISASTLSRLEAGLRRPTLEQLLPLARAPPAPGPSSSSASSADRAKAPTYAPHPGRARRSENDGTQATTGTAGESRGEHGG
nr:helix-turn-helix transcriptional regulator [Micromonospora antibiotica]